MTGNVKDAPTAKAPVGRLEFDAVYKALPRTMPLSLVILIFAVHVTFKVFVFPIGTEPKSTGLVQVSGKATGEP